MFTKNATPLIKKILDPSPSTLFAVAFIALAAALFNGYPNAKFLIKGSVGNAEIIDVADPSEDYARYLVSIHRPNSPSVQGVIDSDRRNLKVGDVIAIFYRRDNPKAMLSIELFAPWTKSIWLTIVGLSALGLGLRERERRTRKKSGPNRIQ